MLPLKVLKGKHRLPLTSSLPRKGKAGCLRTIKFLSAETKVREHRPRSADDRFLPLKWVSRVCSSSIGVFLFFMTCHMKTSDFSLEQPDGSCYLLVVLDMHMHASEKAMAPTPVLLPGKSHGQRSLVGCSPWGHKESDTTERLHFFTSALRETSPMLSFPPALIPVLPSSLFLRLPQSECAFPFFAFT